MVQDYNTTNQFQFNGVMPMDLPKQVNSTQDHQNISQTSIFGQPVSFQEQNNVQQNVWQNQGQSVANTQSSIFGQPVYNEQRNTRPVVEQPVIIQNQMPQQTVIQPQNNNLESNTVIEPKVKKELLITSNPKSSFSEAIKSIRTNLSFAAVDKEIKTILVTSPEPGDGKSSISSNLAGAYAQDNKKVLIIDCDLRKGRQAEIFETRKKATKGYTSLILNYVNEDKNFNIQEYIETTDTQNIDLIPNGPTPPNPIELLASDKNKEVLQNLKELYDIIILDCPPVLGLSDTLIMTKYSDANIVVVSKGKTKIELLGEVKKSFEKANSSITGVVINKAKQKHNSYYGYYGEH